MLHKEEVKSTPAKGPNLSGKSTDSKEGDYDKHQGSQSDQSFCATASLSLIPRFPSVPKFLLATARIYVRGPHGQQVLVRSLVDQGSQSSLITHSLCDTLSLKTHPASISLTGVGDSSTTSVRKRTYITFQPHFELSFKCDTEVLVVPKISSYKPPISRSLLTLPHIQGLQLADPDLYALDKIDVLLGASVHAHVIQNSIRWGPANQPNASASSIGWLLSGPVPHPPENVPSAKQENHMITAQPEEVTVMHISKDLDLIEIVQRFWLVEEPLFIPELKEEDLHCEEHFVHTHSRSSDGRFVVRLPFKGQVADAFSLRESSYNTALSMFRQQEKRFRNNPHLFESYKTFMAEYLALGHMREVSNSSLAKCFLPHHGVLKTNTPTPKLRVVFNGSARNRGGLSLNSLLHTGPNLLLTLFELILRWRTLLLASGLSGESKMLLKTQRRWCES
ncbi:uncharacterized protein LOC106645810 [Copidosoma floridanum]|uniref:uncharacterized protein LOC106645810 n=1 Tax=Copidosoma floridanum TaxID=29053 RepID=UPI0006C9A3B2|nr:uncharacterized protein LOC106645810 [Copidosoma floridanum]